LRGDLPDCCVFVLDEDQTLQAALGTRGIDTKAPIFTWFGAPELSLKLIVGFEGAPNDTRGGSCRYGKVWDIFSDDCPGAN
jgi:hypothetical protein